MTTEQKAKIATLTAAVKAAESNMKSAPREKVMEAYDAFDAAKKELQEYEDSTVTPEQVQAQKTYDLALEAANVAKKNLEDATAELKKYKPVKGGNTGKGGGTGPKADGYETAQKIREELAGGAKVKDVAEKYGVSESACGYYKNYTQHKLKKGDTAFTPLVNKFYPLGAPYAEDGVKEDNERYKVKSYTFADLLSDLDKEGAKKEEVSEKYAMNVEKLEKLVAEHTASLEAAKNEANAAKTDKKSK